MSTLSAPTSQWQAVYNQLPLSEVPRHFASLRTSPFLMQYMTAVLQLCPRGGRTCETGIGSGYSAIWLSLRGVNAEGIDNVAGLVERARQVNNLLGGGARFRGGDLFSFYADTLVFGRSGEAGPSSGDLLLPGKDFPFPGASTGAALPRYDVIHHQGVLEHFTVPRIRAALAQQVACARHVVFSVPSVYYTDPEIGDERLLPLEEWERILAPFDVAELKYYGHPQSGDRDHILCVLRGQPVDEALLAMMEVGDESYPQGISAIVQTRDEERHIAACLETLQGWTDEIIVCDMESSDATVEIAKRFTDNIVAHPYIANFDAARNVSAMRAKYRWVFYLDADERVPPGLGPSLRNCVEHSGDEFEAMLIPFRHHFAGHWMKSMYPGYTSARLFKNGRFVFNARLHAGAQVDGRSIHFPADDSSLALTHYSFDSFSHYLTKLNRYTDGEAINMHRDGRLFHWQHAIRHFVGDFKAYYDMGTAAQDGVHGFIYSFLSAFYRFEQHAKLFELRHNNGRLQPAENAVPHSVEEVLEYALSVLREETPRQINPLRVQPRPIQDSSQPSAAEEDGTLGQEQGGTVLQIGGGDVGSRPGIALCGPLFDPSGYGEELRNFVRAAEAAGLPVAAQELPWSRDEVAFEDEERAHLRALTETPVEPGFTQFVQNFPTGFARHPAAGIAIGRTMFETDRLPREWVKGCNRMDYVWVPSEFNRQTFAAAGVVAEKLVVVPSCLDVRPWEDEALLKRRKTAGERFSFLTVFDWTLHKGWDVLLRAFLRAFEGDQQVELVFKVWSTMGYDAVSIQAQARRLAQEEFGHDLAADDRIRFVSERLDASGLRDLYRDCDAFVLPSRGEGWGRPYMEAMACGRPVIGTNWSGNTAFMTDENSYLLDCEVIDVPETGWREIPTYRGHRWAEPDEKQLQELMRRVREETGEANVKARRAREGVMSRFNAQAVGKIIATELDRAYQMKAEKTANAQVRQVAKADEAGPAPASSLILPATYVEQQEAAAQPIAVRWEGHQFQWHSLAHVNREFCIGLQDSGRADLSLVTDGPQGFALDDDSRFDALAERLMAPLARPASVHVRHFFPPRLQAPEEGHLVLIQPWEYGYLPEQWLQPIRDNVSEVWCYSNYVRDVYKASGIDEAKLHVVPLGVDETVFTPQAPPFVFTIEPGARRYAETRRKNGARPFTFLYTGGTIHRKGFDILLEAYLKAFSAFDDVCLVVKDTGTQTVYRGVNESERVRALAEDPSRPALVYVEEDLTSHQLAGIYTAADCLVMPYRGEGFLLPALEAMSCGLPVIVTAGGPTDDFVDGEVGWRVEAERKPLGSPRVGEYEFCGPAWQFEVGVETLARQMRAVLAKPEEAARRGAAGADRVRQSWTWRHATEAALARLEVLNRTPVSKPDANGAVSTKGAKVVTKTKSRSKQALSSQNGKPGRTAPTISLCMIVRNEERVLGDCLTSIKPWVDEIVLVDTGSTDRTVEIAEEHGAIVKHFPWTDCFSTARNVSIEAATGDWILWMDADDTIPEECGRQLHELVLLAEDATTGFIMQVHIPPAPGMDGFTKVDHVKLFRNWPELRFEGRIHEQILEAIYRAGGRIERSDLHVVHSGYDYSPEGQERKRERDIGLLEKDLRDRPDHPFVLFNIGMTAYHLKDYKKAIPALERSLEVCGPKESIRRKLYAMRAGCDSERGMAAEARGWIERGLGEFPRDPELLFRAGAIYRDLNDLEASVRSYETLLSGHEVGHIDSLDVSMTSYKAHHNLALSYLLIGRFADAERSLRAAVASKPDFVPSWAALGDLYLRTGQVQQAREVVERLRGLAPEVALQLEGQIARVPR